MTSLTLNYPLRLAVKLRGAVMLTLGLVALVRTGDQIAGAMNAVALVVCGTAVIEAVILLRDRVHKTTWWLSLADAILALFYGGLTLQLPMILSASPIRAVAAVDAWLLAATLFAGILMLNVWEYRLPRVVLIAWMILNAVLAIAGPADPPLAIAGLFVGGALYTGVFGALELAGVLWLERMASHEPRNRGYVGL